MLFSLINEHYIIHYYSSFIINENNMINTIFIKEEMFSYTYFKAYICHNSIYKINFEIANYHSTFLWK